jgi:hypothetical protein
METGGLRLISGGPIHVFGKTNPPMPFAEKFQNVTESSNLHDPAPRAACSDPGRSQPHPVSKLLIAIDVGTQQGHLFCIHLPESTPFY